MKKIQRKLEKQRFVSKQTTMHNEAYNKMSHFFSPHLVHK